MHPHGIVSASDGVKSFDDFTSIIDRILKVDGADGPKQRHMVKRDFERLYAELNAAPTNVLKGRLYKTLDAAHRLCVLNFLHCMYR